METIIKQQQNLSFRAVTIADLDRIVKLYYEQKTPLDAALTKQFGLPFYVAELNNKIVGYSYATPINSENYNLKTHIDKTLSNEYISENLVAKSADFFEKEWQSGNYKNLSVAITQLIKWLNNSNS